MSSSNEESSPRRAQSVFGSCGAALLVASAMATAGLAVLTSSPAGASQLAGTIVTVAGGGTGGQGSGLGGPATSAELSTPRSTIYDASGNEIVADNGSSSQRIDVVANSATNPGYTLSGCSGTCTWTQGDIYDIAGTGTLTYGGDGGPATSATFNTIKSMVFDTSGNLIVADSGNNRVRVIALSTSNPGYTLSGCSGTCTWTKGDIFTIAGSGASATTGDGGAATSAGVDNPDGVMVDSSGNLLVSEQTGGVIRLVAESASNPGYTCASAHPCTTWTKGDIYTIVGTGTPGYNGDGIAATSAEVNRPGNMAFDASGNLVFGDFTNNRVRVLALSATNPGYALSGCTGTCSWTQGDLFTIAGNGNAAYGGDGGAATSAELNNPNGVAFDAQGDLIIADTDNSLVRIVAEGASDPGYPLAGCSGTCSWTKGDIYTIAGTGTAAGYNGDGVATSTELNVVDSVVTNASGNVLLSDFNNNRGRLLENDTVTVTGITPSHGPDSGATTVTITGTNFTGATSVDFGTTAASSFTVNSPTQITATSPAGTGTVDVTVSVSGDASATSTADQFTYAPSVTGISPSSGAYLGGTSVTITGTGFSGGDTVSFGSTQAVAADVNVNSSTEITATSPYESAGTVDVTVTGTAGTSATSAADQFTYTGLTANDIYQVAGGGSASVGGNPATSVDVGAVPAGQVTTDPEGNELFAQEFESEVIVVAVSSSNPGYPIGGCSATCSWTVGDAYVVAGTGAPGYNGDGISATSAKLKAPFGVAVDQDGNVVIGDAANRRVRVVAVGNNPGYSLGGCTGTCTWTDGDIYTIAGTGTAGNSGIGGPALSAELSAPSSVAIDAHQNVVITDADNGIVEVVAVGNNPGYSLGGCSATCTWTDGDIYDVAGDGTAGYAGDGGFATSAELQPQGVSVDSSGNLVIADTENNRIRVVAVSSTNPGYLLGGCSGTCGWTDGDIYTIAGDGTENSTGNGGPATSAGLAETFGVTTDQAGNVILSDTEGDQVRLIAVSANNPGYSLGGCSGTCIWNVGDIYTLAGNGTGGTTGNGGPATSAELNAPTGVAVTPTDSVMVLTAGGLRLVDEGPGVTAVSPSSGSYLGGTDVTISGTGFGSDATVSFGSAEATAVNVDSSSEIQALSPYYATGTVNVTVTSGGTTSSTSSADQFTYTSLSQDDIYQVTEGIGKGNSEPSGDTYATSTPLGGAYAVTTDSEGNEIVTDQANNQIDVIAVSENNPGYVLGGCSGTCTWTVGDIYTIAGNGGFGYTGDGGSALTASLEGPQDAASDAQGNVLIADTFNGLVRVVAVSDTNPGYLLTGCPSTCTWTEGDIYTMAGSVVDGSPQAGYSGDGGPATSAQLSKPAGLAVDASGNVLVSDQRNDVVQVVALSASNPGYTLSGCSSTCTWAQGDIYTIAGDGDGGYSGDGIGATSAASLKAPQGVATDSSGNVLIADAGNNLVRVVAVSNTNPGYPLTGCAATCTWTPGDIFTIAGNTGKQGLLTGDGGPATSAPLGNPSGVAIDADGNVVIADNFASLVRIVAVSSSNPGYPLGGCSGTCSWTAGDIYAIAGTDNDGTSQEGDSGYGSLATSAKLSVPQGVAVAPTGDVLIADPGNDLVSKVVQNVPTVTSVSPAYGSPEGGTSVTVTGNNFTGAKAVDFGSSAATNFTVDSDTEITATSPSGSGTVNVTVTTPDGISLTSSADQFAYGPTVEAVSPSTGSADGATSVTITGTNFDPAFSAVEFGTGNFAASVTVDSSTQITATSPAGTGTVDVQVITFGGISQTSAADQFSYQESKPAITAFAVVSYRLNVDESYTMFSTGAPFATWSESGTLPTGLTFQNDGFGEATISGTPTGTGGAWPITVTASNDAGSAEKSISIQVDEAPQFTSSATPPAWTVGVYACFEVTTANSYPSAVTLSAAAFPIAGLTFTDQGNGTAEICGAPTKAKTETATISAKNIVLSSTQSITVVINS